MGKSSLSTFFLLVFCTLSSVQSKAGTTVYPGSICHQRLIDSNWEVGRINGSAEMRYTGTNTTIITNVTCPIPRHNALTNKGPLKIEVSYFADYYGDFGITPNCRVIAYNRYGDVEIMRKTKNVPGLGRRVISLGKLPAAASKGKIVVDCSLGGNSRYGDFIGSILVTEEDS